MNTTSSSDVPAIRVERRLAYRSITSENTPIALDSIRHEVPSLFARSPFHTVSSRYTVIPTIDILEGLQKEGFFPYQISQSRGRTEERTNYAKHMIRLRRQVPDTVTREDVNEVILINSHDGTTAYRLMAGIFRFVCANGLVIGSVTDEWRVPHTGDILGRVLEGAYTVVNQFRELDEWKATLKAIPVNREQLEHYGEQALRLRWPSTQAEERLPIDATTITRARRQEDTENSLWKVYNRVQENLITGGQSVLPQLSGRRRTRPLRDILRTTRLNQNLWALTKDTAQALAA